MLVFWALFYEALVCLATAAATPALQAEHSNRSWWQLQQPEQATPVRGVPVTEDPRGFPAQDREPARHPREVPVTDDPAAQAAHPDLRPKKFEHLAVDDPLGFSSQDREPARRPRDVPIAGATPVQGDSHAPAFLAQLRQQPERDHPPREVPVTEDRRGPSAEDREPVRVPRLVPAPGRPTTSADPEETQSLTLEQSTDDPPGAPIQDREPARPPRDVPVTDTPTVYAYRGIVVAAAGQGLRGVPLPPMQEVHPRAGPQLGALPSEPEQRRPCTERDPPPREVPVTDELRDRSAQDPGHASPPRALHAPSSGGPHPCPGALAQAIPALPHVDPHNDTEEVSSLQAYAWVFLGAHLTEAFEDSWQDGELAPDWFWDLLDMGGDLCRAGVKAADLAILLTEFASTRRDTLPDYFWQTEPIRNRLMRAWEVVCAHYFTCDLPLPPGLNDRQFSRMAEESIRHQWHRARIEGRDLFKAREPPPEARRDTDVDPPGRALPEGSCRQHPDFDADAPPRSTSPPPGLGQHERSRSPKRRHRMATSSTYRTQSDQAAQGPDSSRYTDAPDPDEDPDFTALVADRWLLKPQKTHLKRSSPRRITTETVILRAPWKKGGNPPLQTRPSGPVHPTFPPPPTSTKPRVTCPIDLEEADDETEEVAVEINATANDEAIAVWQALFEFEPREALEPSAVPVIPQSNLDNMVETLLDKPEPEYQQMVRSATSFLARMATDVHSAIERAKALRDRLRNKPSSSKGPEAEEGSLMQTTIENVLASPKAAILALLRDAFLALTPGACVARAQQLLAKLKDHEGPLAVDRQTLQAALIVYSQGNPETATGDRYICQFAWVAHWWAVLEGRKLPGPASSDIDFLDRALPESGESDVDPALAEQLQFEEEEKAYQQGLEEAVAHHERMAKANPGSPAAETGPGPTSPTRRDQGSTNRSAFQWHPPTKRLCLGICFADGRQQKAWDWELNVGDQVDLHVRAQYRDRPGYWTREGRPVPYEQLPPSLQAEYGPSTSSSSSDRLPPAAPHFSMNLDRPATRALYDRWQRGIIGDHAVRDVGGDTFLQFFRACSNIGEDTLAEVECLDTMPGPPAEGRDPSDVTQLDEPGEHTGPTSTTSTSRPVLTSHGGLDDQAHPDPYYNGELYWERYGRQDESEQDSESS